MTARIAGARLMMRSGRQDEGRAVLTEIISMTGREDDAAAQAQAVIDSFSDVQEDETR